MFALFGVQGHLTLPSERPKATESCLWLENVASVNPSGTKNIQNILRVQILRMQKAHSAQSSPWTRGKSNYKEKVNQTFESELAAGNLCNI